MTFKQSKREIGGPRIAWSPFEPLSFKAPSPSASCCLRFAAASGRLGPRRVLKSWTHRYGKETGKLFSPRPPLPTATPPEDNKRSWCRITKSKQGKPPIKLQHAQRTRLQLCLLANWRPMCFLNISVCTAGFSTCAVPMGCFSSGIPLPPAPFPGPALCESDSRG